MSFQPRMRGTRFRRPSMKKQSSKGKREDRDNPIGYQEKVPMDPATVSARVLNSLEHLGSQRFALPPFSDHFERWITDVSAILVELETELPEAADQAYRQDSERTLSEARQALQKRIEDERQISDELATLHKELSSSKFELTNLEHDYKTRAHEARRGHERSLEKIKGEIDSLDKQRLKLLRKRPSILERIFHKPRTSLEESTRTLESKKTDMGSKQKTLAENLERLRTEYEIRRKEAVDHQETLTAKLAEFRTNTPDDALDIRNRTCQELGRTVLGAIRRLSESNASSKSENIQ